MSISTLLKSALMAILLFAVCSAAFASADDFNFKGIWIRPVNDETSVTIQLDNIKKAGFNAVYVETFYHGHTLFESDYVKQRPEMKGTDFLKLYLDGCHKRGLQFHAWIEVYYWGVDIEKYPQYPKTDLFVKHPDWEIKLIDGRNTGYAENAHFFADPANPEVRKFLADFIKEIITKYDVDGVNLDYIRYSSGNPDSGFSDYAIKEFAKETGLEAKKTAADPKGKDYIKWLEFKEEQILKTVRMIKDVRDKTKKEVVLSAAVFPLYPQDRMISHTAQNWMKMIDEGLLDVIAPMAYEFTLDGIEKEIKSISFYTDKAKKKIQIYPALAVQTKNIDAYSGTSHPKMTEQMKRAKKLGLNGFSVFCYDWMMGSDEGLDLLKDK